MRSNRNIPIVVVSGATGTGKTKLSIEIAKHYDGEIINADALQIYKGMDIATNKATESECQGIIHHLLGFKNVETLDFTIHDFQKLALDKIDEIRSRNKMPVLVGGTNYYIESVLWPKLIDVQAKNHMDQCNSMDNIELYELLKRLDFDSAVLLHPNDRRKVWRAVSIALNSQQTQSDLLNEQEKTRRFDLNEIVFLWIYSEVDSLFPRLDKRVDEMIKLGLLNELSEIQVLFEKLCPSKEYTKGIFQAIGFKEFHDYLNYYGDNEVVRGKILKECIEKLKIANKQYVKIQNKWIKNRFLKKGKETENIPLFKLDSSDVEKWNENVFERSIRIIDDIIKSVPVDNYSAFVKGLQIQPEPLRCEVTYTPCHRVCDICDSQIFIAQEQWVSHIQSRRHQKRKRSIKKSKEKNLEIKIAS